MSRLIRIDDETKTLSEWCREYRIPKHVVIMRVKRGMDYETAITKPPRRYRSRKREHDA